MNQLQSPSTRFDRGTHVASDGFNLPQGRLNDAGRYRPPERRVLNRGDSYFDDRSATAPSPTATLVADLAQNFHLGASPAVPTPRRSLMAQFSLHEDHPSLDRLGPPCTPNADLQSSPGEMMDTSPVPLVARRTLARASSMFEPEHPSSFSSGLFPCREPPQRPPLISRKAFSTFAVPTVPAVAERKTFAFANASSSSVDKENSLASQFEDSPKKTPRKFFNLGFTRKAQETSPSSNDDLIERSPLAPISFNAINKRLPQFRRTQSMVTKNDDFLVPDLPHCTPTSRPPQTPISPEQQQLATCTILPSFESKQDQLPRITGFTLAQVLDGHYRSDYDKLEVIDCRFPHEYDGGHIPQAINVSSLDAMDRHPLLSSPLPLRTLIILHCEYSAHRAPRIALHLRNRDRMLNAHRYPKLFYPEVYILDGGYSNFYRDFRHHVGTSGYVEMNDPVHRPFASRQMHDFRKNTKFQRTQSYTFGQDSPIGGARMEREVSFKLKPSQSQNFQGIDSIYHHSVPDNSHRRSIGEFRMSDADPDESGEGSSMMDVDETSMNSPVPSYSDTTNNTFQRTHGRTSSGRIDPRRLCSF